MIVRGKINTSGYGNQKSGGFLYEIAGLLHEMSFECISENIILD